MSDLNKKNFYNEVVALLEEIEEIYDDHDFEEEYTGDDTAKFDEVDALKNFIEHIRDAKSIAEENS